MEVHCSSGALLFGAQPQDVNGGVWIGGTLVGVYRIASEAVDFLLGTRTSPPHLRCALFGAPCEGGKKNLKKVFFNCNPT